MTYLTLIQLYLTSPQNNTFRHRTMQVGQQGKTFLASYEPSSVPYLPESAYEEMMFWTTQWALWG